MATLKNNPFLSICWASRTPPRPDAWLGPRHRPDSGVDGLYNIYIYNIYIYYIDCIDMLVIYRYIGDIIEIFVYLIYI
jgi:hypothetical protein